MRSILSKALLSLLLLVSSQGFTLEAKDTNITAGIGLLGSRGLVGFSGDYLFDSHHALTIGIGADFLGTLQTVGYRYFDNSINTSQTGTFLDKCFFFFECKSYPFLGIAAQRAPKHEVNITSREANIDYNNIYLVNEKEMLLASFGTKSILTNNITVEWEFSYRSHLYGGKNKLLSGQEQRSDQTMLNFANNGFGVGFGMGYLF
jgi:hypothetical protein